MSRGSSLRTFLAPHGDVSRDAVAKGNKMVSRLLVYSYRFNRFELLMAQLCTKFNHANA